LGWEKNIIGKESNRDNESNKAAVNNSFPPYSLPFTVSLLISGSLFFDIYSPASTLIIPFIRKNVPFGYFIIILMEFITALMVMPSFTLASVFEADTCKVTSPTIPEKLAGLGSGSGFT